MMLTRSFDLAIMVICLALLGYTGWSYQYGPRGLGAYTALAGRIEALQADLKTVSEERQKRDQRVGLLRPETLDPDMLDEMARRTLDYTAPGELVVK